MDEYEDTLAHRNRSVRDPLQTGRIARRTSIAPFVRAANNVGGTIRKSGRRVRKKAGNLRRSVSYAANRPILPYHLIGETQSDGRRFISEHEYMSRHYEEGKFSQRKFSKTFIRIEFYRGKMKAVSRCFGDFWPFQKDANNEEKKVFSLIFKFLSRNFKNLTLFLDVLVIFAVSFGI
jgi:hypothetical protein